MLDVMEIKRFIDEDRCSSKKQYARKGLRYYEGDHDIRDYKVYYFDDNSLLREDETKSNIKISHPFFTELIDQCTQYMLSGKGDYVRSDIPQLQTLLNEYFDDDFKMELNDLITYAKVEGFSYLYRYVDEDFKTRFRFADGLHVVEVPGKYSSDGKDYVIYYFFYKREKDKDIFKVQVWDDEAVHYYVMQDSMISEDKDEAINPKPHIIYEEDGTQYYDTFGDIPFLRLDNNRRQVSDLKIVKNLIDDYDLMSCGLSNNIQDVAEGIYVVKGYEGSDLSELTQAIRVKKQVGVGENGDVDIKTINIPYQARVQKLELDEKNIYRFGMGYNSNQLGDGNVTNVVIKSRYALLDLKCNKLEMQLKRLMKKVLKIVLNEINDNNETSYTLKDVYIEFEREVITNALDNATIEKTDAERRQVEINTLLNVATQLGDETLLENICNVLELDYEQVKDKLPEEAPLDINAASEQLLNTEETPPGEPVVNE